MLVPGRVAGVDVLRIHPEQARELLDDHLEDELTEIIVAVGTRQHRAPVHHDPRRVGPGARAVPGAGAVSPAPGGGEPSAAPPASA